MSIRHRFLAVCLAFAVGLPFSISKTQAGPNDSAQPVGPVGLRELIRLALRNDPKLVQLRSQISVEEAKKRAIPMNQWRDPELRISHSKDNNIQLDQPYERSGQIIERTGGSSSTSESGDGGTKSESGSSNEIRRTTYTERIIPGRNSDQITRTETEHRSTDSSTSKTDFRGTENDEASENETFRSSREETRFDSRDRFARDQTTSVKVRFWIPNPWEKKALLNQATTEIDLANYEITAAEREVILEVREQYEDLQYLYKKLKASTSKIAIIKKHVAKENAIVDASEELIIADLGLEELEIPGIEMEKEALANELRAAKSDLAASVGLKDGSRIRVTDKLLRSTINLLGTDLDYLTRMAFAHRGEIGILKHEQAITESQLDIIKAKRIPWLSFVEGAYAKDSTGGHHTNDNYGVQAGVVLPLFSWLSKDEEVVQEQIKAYYTSLEANQTHIANQVAEAFRSVKEKARERTRAESLIASAAKKLEAQKARLKDSEDLLAIEKVRYEVESRHDKFYKYILDADRRYNESLIRLEQALGADLDQVFNYKFEPIAGAVQDNEDEVLAAAAPSSRLLPLAPKAKAVPKTIVLPSEQKAAPAKAAKPKRLGLFRRSKKQAQPDAEEDKPRKKTVRRGILSGRKK